MAGPAGLAQGSPPPKSSVSHASQPVCHGLLTRSLPPSECREYVVLLVHPEWPDLAFERGGLRFWVHAKGLVKWLAAAPEGTCLCLAVLGSCPIFPSAPPPLLPAAWGLGRDVSS